MYVCVCFRPLRGGWYGLALGYSIARPGRPCQKEEAGFFAPGYEKNETSTPGKSLVKILIRDLCASRALWAVLAVHTPAAAGELLPFDSFYSSISPAGAQWEY